MKDPRTQAMFERSRHNNLSICTISQEHYELPKRTVRAKGNIYHIFKPTKHRAVQKLYKDKAYMDMTLNQFKYLTSTCWDNKYQPVTFDMTRCRYTGCYRLGLKNSFVPDSSFL